MNRQVFERAAGLVEQISQAETFIKQLSFAIESEVELNVRVERGGSYYYELNRTTNLFSDKEIKNRLKEVREVAEYELVELKKDLASL